ncbi:MAG: hypothetical protein ACRYHA_13760 [Janthinobacterium lividum]
MRRNLENILARKKYYENIFSIFRNDRGLRMLSKTAIQPFFSWVFRQLGAGQAELRGFSGNRARFPPDGNAGSPPGLLLSALRPIGAAAENRGLDV